MIFACLLLLAPSVDDSKAARELLDKAITAMGGVKLLSAPHAVTGKSKGTMTLFGSDQQLSNTWTVQGLDRLRWDSDVGKNRFNVGLSPKGGWISGNGGMAGDLPKEYLPAFRRGVVALRIAESLIGLRGKEWKLASLGELKIDDMPTMGIKASRKGEPDIDIYFDKKTHLPVQVEIRLAKPRESAEMVLKATLSDYRKIAGRQHFGKMVVTQDGTKVLEVERSEIKVVDKPEDTTFDKP